MMKTPFLKRDNLYFAIDQVETFLENPCMAYYNFLILYFGRCPTFNVLCTVLKGRLIQKGLFNVI